MASNTKMIAALGLAALLATPVSAFWRMPCPGRLVIERIDPLIFPGIVSPHVHTVSGGSGFGFETNYAQQRASACSSCPIKQDLSAYWTPKLYYMGEGGSYFEDVPQAGEGNGVTGGMTVYYEQRGPQGADLLAFPPEFRMIAGDPFQRSFTGEQAAPGYAVSFVCLDYSGTSTYSNNMPNQNCPDGLRAQVYFPSCWDGVHTDSPDHSSHMAYPLGGHYDNGPCPASHPNQTVSIFFEVIYQTGNFANRWHNPNHHPFIFAQGDRTGYGFHGDFINGWNTTALQSAIDTCTADSGSLSDCPVFDDLYSDAECQACKLPPQVNEATTGNLTTLPGCNPVSNGPGHETPITNCAVTPIGSPTQYFTDVTSSLGWEYVGCANDSLSERTFQGSSSGSASMTVETCIASCKAGGFSLAGLEFGSQCYCDNKYYDDPSGPRSPVPNLLGDCWQPCAGNGGQICGGSAALSVYKSCEGGACSNDVFHVNGTAGAPTKRRRHVHGAAGGHHGHGRL